MGSCYQGGTFFESGINIAIGFPYVNSEDGLTAFNPSLTHFPLVPKGCLRQEGNPAVTYNDGRRRCVQAQYQMCKSMVHTLYESTTRRVVDRPDSLRSSGHPSQEGTLIERRKKS